MTMQFKKYYKALFVSSAVASFVFSTPAFAQMGASTEQDAPVMVAFGGHPAKHDEATTTTETYNNEPVTQSTTTTTSTTPNHHKHKSAATVKTTTEKVTREVAPATGVAETDCDKDHYKTKKRTTTTTKKTSYGTDNSDNTVSGRSTGYVREKNQSYSYDKMPPEPSTSPDAIRDPNEVFYSKPTVNDDSSVTSTTRSSGYNSTYNNGDSQTTTTTTTTTPSTSGDATYSSKTTDYKAKDPDYVTPSVVDNETTKRKKKVVKVEKTVEKKVTVPDSTTTDVD